MLARPAPTEEDPIGALVALTQNVLQVKFVSRTRELFSCVVNTFRGDANSCRFLSGDRACHISSVQYPPSESPTVSPTNYTSPEPTNSAPEYDDPVFTSFCGTTWLEASASCSIDTYCPSGVHADCPGDNQYCWASTSCNVHDFWPSPTPEPSKSPSVKNTPSEAPSAAPSIDSTGIPTHSPFPEDDIRNFMYCGTDYVSVSSVSSLHFAKKKLRILTYAYDVRLTLHRAVGSSALIRFVLHR